VFEQYFRLLDFLYRLGEMLIKDDIMDYGRFDRIHHWQWGEMLRQGAFLGSTLLALYELREANAEG